MKFAIVASAFVLAAVPSAFADESAFLGTWTSNWQNMIDAKMVVHSVDGDKADMTYSWEETKWGPAGTVRMDAKVSGNTLQFSGPTTTFTFTMRGDVLDAERKWSGGVNKGTFRKVD